SWAALKSGLPTIDVRDIDIQRRENDLIVGTFGRGIYVLDDISVLRTPRTQVEGREATLFTPKDALLYVPRTRFGGGKKGSRGGDYYQEDNPPYGAVFTYFLKDGYESLRKKRRDLERERLKAGEDNPYPSWDELRAEDHEEDPVIELVVRDTQGAVVRRLSGKTKKGFHRVAWDMRFPALTPVSLKKPGFKPPWWEAPKGPLVLPGTYTVELTKRIDGRVMSLGTAKTFLVVALENGSPLVTKDRPALLAFQQKTGRLQRAVEGAAKSMGELKSRIAHLKKAIAAIPVDLAESYQNRLRRLESRLEKLEVAMMGDRAVSSRNEPVPWSILQRVGSVVGGHWSSQAAPTQTHRDAYESASKAFQAALKEIRILDTYIQAIEQQVEQLGAPWTPGRIPTWEP
ncbi:MAG: glycosyl hydrolase, partial [Myxococcota bacterium]